MAVREKAMATLPTLMRAMRKRTPNHMPSNQPLPSLRRAFSLYDQINLIDNVPEDQIRFQQVTDTGFRVKGVHYEAYLSSRQCDQSQKWTLHVALLVPFLLRPKILLLGCGKYIQPVNPELRAFIRATGMKLEAIDSRNAASTYNILNEEGRIVAAALLPYGVES